MIYCIILTVFSAFHQSVLLVLTHSKRSLPKKLELFTNFDSFKFVPLFGAIFLEITQWKLSGIPCLKENKTV